MDGGHMNVEGTARLEHASCFDLLPTLPPKSIDLVVTSPPYFMGKAYDRSKSPADFAAEMRRLVPQLKRILKPGGSICWQVGYHVDDGVVRPLDWDVHTVMSRHPGFHLRNRIIWTFGHGEHCTTRFSGRHETVLWYTLGPIGTFDLDSVRVPQRYPGKTHYRGPHRGELSGNPLGKNPGDLWEIPNVKANHVEKTEHPCQFPVALVTRLVMALTREDATILDPYMGSGTSAIAALMTGRSFIGCDTEERYVRIAKDRVSSFQRGELRTRSDVPVAAPNVNSRVARRPDHFRAPDLVEKLVEST